ncbi:hypothetical protein [Arthrobacter sp. B2a2-09]|uniref:hypothetical protein n=1 Tax=Arthrobacter sp. B2a2-09 TaxID=2952822 RepID=UPI0022CD93F4|nr:hypothetical protein [Arthrobacter sp. B2a2-09]MCZ9884053.1 hypothetical protein [Arthrobacter sp. B2a2-09]
MTTENPDYDIHRISFIDNPEEAGLPAEFLGMGMLLITQQGSDQRGTVLVDHDYAVTALTARQELDGMISLAATAARWLRLGWPEDWGADLLSTWAPLYLEGSQA